MGSGTVTLSDGLDENGDPTIITLEGGRLWFVAGDQRVDVTDQVDEETPYIWTQWLEDGSLHYIVVGEPQGGLRWFEGLQLPMAAAAGAEYSTAGPTCPTSRWTLPGIPQARHRSQELWKKQHQ